MSIYDTINQRVNLKDLLTSFCGQGKKEGIYIKFLDVKTGEKSPSLTYFGEYGSPKWGWYSFSAGEKYTDVIDAVCYFLGLSTGEAIERLKSLYGDFEVEERKTIKHEDLWKKFNEFKPNINIFKKWLTTRGVDILEYQEQISNAVGQLGTASVWLNPIDEYKEVIIFPCRDSTGEIVGAKLRKADGNKIREVKSMTIKGSSTGFIRDSIQDTMILCEGEADYIILKLLGFHGVIANLGGATSKLNELKKLLKNVKTIVSFLDYDNAGVKATKKLTEVIYSTVTIPNWDIIENPSKAKLDVNILFKDFGFKKPDFDAMILQATTVKLVETPASKQGIILKDDGTYLIDNNSNEVKVLNYHVHIVDILVFQDLGGEKELRLKLTNGTTTAVIDFDSKEIRSVPLFDEKVGRFCERFFSYNLDKQKLISIMEFAFENFTSYTYVVGKRGFNVINNNHIWVFDNGIYTEGKGFSSYSEDKSVRIGNDKIIFLTSKGNSNFINFSEDKYDDNIFSDLKKDMEYLFGVMGDLLIGHFFSSLLFMRCKDILTPFPILGVFGKKGSGKTTGINIALRMLGYDNYSPQSIETTSEFIDQKHISDSRVFPLWRDEFKTSKRGQKDNFLKSVFDRAGISKGQKDLSEVSFNVETSLILSGEIPPKDNAVMSRLLFIQMEKNKSGGSEMFFSIKKRSQKYNSFIQKFLRNIDHYEKYYREKRLIVKDCLINNGVEQRLLEVFIPGITGFVCFSELYLGKKLNIAEVVHNFAEQIEDKFENELEDDVLNLFFNNVTYLAQNGDIPLNRNYIKILDDNIIDLDINFIFGKITEKNRQGELTLSLLKKMLQSELKGDTKRGYVIGENGENQQKRLFSITNSFLYSGLNQLIKIVEGSWLYNDSKLDIIDITKSRYERD